MGWQFYASAAIGILMTIFFTALIVGMIRSDRRWQRNAEADLNRVKAMLAALPEPKNPIPTTIRKRTK